MLILITGQPGNGKTLRALDLARVEQERNKKANDLPEGSKGWEPLRRFFSNIAGATVEENAQAFSWMEPLPEHNDWTKLPNGSYVIYDEAHSDGATPGLERYGELFPATGRPGESNDPRIRAMSTHRHRGFDIVLVTQWPSKIHHQVRSLVGKHLHMNRAMGLQRAGVLTWTRVQSDPYDERQREKAEEEIWAYETDLYSRYHSATVHTSTYKFKIPAKAWQGLAMLIVGLLVAWLLWLFLFKPDVVQAGEGEAEAAQVQAPNGAHAPPLPGGDDEYFSRHIPRSEEMPWSAPIFDDRKPTADPQLFCMLASPGLNANDQHSRNSQCRCLTEQGTLYLLEMTQCAHVARWGQPYNPYKERQEEREVPGYADGFDGPSIRPISAQVSGYAGTVGAPTVDRTFGTLTRSAP